MASAANPYRDQRTQYDPGMGMDELCDALNLGLYIGVNAPSGASPTISSAIISFLQSGSGALSETVERAMQNGVVSLLSYADTVATAHGNGTVDDTTMFSQAFAAAVGRVLYIPKPSSKYKIDSLDIPSNTTLLIAPGTIIEANTGYGANDRLLRILDVSDVTIHGHGATLTMNGLYATGEHKHNLAILGGTRVKVYGLRSTLAGGDGFYVGAGVTNAFCEDVVLQDCISHQNRRNNLSIVSVKKLRVRGGSYTEAGQGTAGGTSPETGIDIEPNSGTDRIEDVVIEAPSTAGNVDNVGISVSPSGFANTGNRFEVTITGHTSNNDAGAFQVNALDAGASPPVGWIKYNGQSYLAEQFGIRIIGYDVLGPRITLDHPVVINCNESGAGGSSAGSGIVVFRDTAAGGPTTIGNVEIISPDIYDTRATAQMAAAIYVRDLDSESVSKVDVVNPIRLGWADAAKVATDKVDFYGAGTFSDAYGAAVLDNTANLELGRNNYCRLIHNASDAGAQTITLDTDLYVGGPDVTVEVRSANRITIALEGTDEAIYPGGGLAGSFTSNRIGSRMTLRKISATEWYALENTGFTPAPFKVDTGITSHTGTMTETTIFTATTLEDQMKPGDVYHFRASGSFSGTNDTKTVRLKWGSTTLATLVGDAGEQTDWMIEAEIRYRLSNAQVANIKVFNGSAVELFDNVTPGEDTAAGTVAITLTDQLANTGDTIVHRLTDAWRSMRNAA